MEIFDHTEAADMVASWDLKKSIAPEQFKSWPDMSEAALSSFVSAIRGQICILSEAEEEMNRLRGLR